MKATNMSHTVLSAKPVSAHCIDSPGVGATSRRIPTTVMPIRPTAGPGIGSVTRVAMTVTNKAK